MEITVTDLLSRFPWLAGLRSEYLQAVLNDALNTYSTELHRYRDIVLLHTARTIQTEQLGIIQDVLLSNGQTSSRNNQESYLSQQLSELLRAEGVGLLWIE